jgi:ubiquitin C-terminal hydrolase
MEFTEVLSLEKYGIQVFLIFLKYIFNFQEEYSLYAVIVHSGDTFFGHYYCFVKEGGGWVLHDDERVINILHYVPYSIFP